MERNNLSVGLFIDGGYYAKVNEALEDKCALNIRVSSLMKFICRQVAVLAHCDASACYIQRVIISEAAIGFMMPKTSICCIASASLKTR